MEYVKTEVEYNGNTYVAEVTYYIEVYEDDNGVKDEQFIFDGIYGKIQTTDDNGDDLDLTVDELQNEVYELFEKISEREYYTYR